MATILLLMAAGILMILLETVLPGGVVGLVGVGCLVGAVVLAYSTQGAAVGNLVLLGSGASFLAAVVAWFRFFPKSRMGKVFVSETTIGGVEDSFDELVGKKGTAMCDIRPAGIAVFDDRRVDVVGEGDFIEEGEALEVVAVEGNRVVVRALDIP